MNRTVNFIASSILVTAAFASVVALTVISLPTAANAAPLVTHKGSATAFHLTHSQPTGADVDRMWQLLQDVGYPGEIVATTQDDYDAARSGWRSVDASKLRHGKTTPGCAPGSNDRSDAFVQSAKALYCELKTRGYPVPKPTIVAGF